MVDWRFTHEESIPPFPPFRISLFSLLLTDELLATCQERKGEEREGEKKREESENW